jgi:hypothetical protein
LAGAPVTERDRGLVLEMAQGRGSLDRPLIKRYVEYYASELTRRNNIAAMMGSESTGVARPRQLDEATNRLLQPLLEPASASNAPFRREYLNQLKAVAKTLLEGHLFTRIAFMVVLSRAGAIEVVPLLIEQIENPAQTYLVKLLAASGLIQITQNGRVAITPTSDGIRAAKALVAFLNDNPDAPWPVQCRCLEALGALRHATENPLSGRAELADLAFEILVDEQVDAQMRAWAGWAVSRMAFPTQLAGLNLELLAYELGRVAVAAAEPIAKVPVPSATPTKNLRMVARWTEPLVRVLDAFTGDPELRGSGLDRMAAGSSSVRAIEQRVRALATAAAQLSQSAGAQVKQTRDAVAASAAELKAYLDANPPKNDAFYRNGPKAPLPGSEKEAGAAQKGTGKAG